MKLLVVQRNVISGQCKGALVRVQVRYTALVLFSGLLRGWCGAQIGVFSPRHSASRGYSCTGFYFQPWLTPDVPVGRLPKWYRWVVRNLQIRLDGSRP